MKKKETDSEAVSAEKALNFKLKLENKSPEAGKGLTAIAKRIAADAEKSPAKKPENLKAVKKPSDEVANSKAANSGPSSSTGNLLLPKCEVPVKRE